MRVQEARPGADGGTHESTRLQMPRWGAARRARRHNGAPAPQTARQGWCAFRRPIPSALVPAKAGIGPGVRHPQNSAKPAARRRTHVRTKMSARKESAPMMPGSTMPSSIAPLDEPTTTNCSRIGDSKRGANSTPCCAIGLRARTGAAAAIGAAAAMSRPATRCSGRRCRRSSKCGGARSARRAATTAPCARRGARRAQRSQAGEGGGRRLRREPSPCRAHAIPPRAAGRVDASGSERPGGAMLQSRPHPAPSAPPSPSGRDRGARKPGLLRTHTRLWCRHVAR